MYRLIKMYLEEYHEDVKVMGYNLLENGRMEALYKHSTSEGETVRVTLTTWDALWAMSNHIKLDQYEG